MTVQNTSVPRRPAAGRAARAVHLRLARDRAAIGAALAAPPAAAAALLPVRATWPNTNVALLLVVVVAVAAIGNRTAGALAAVSAAAWFDFFFTRPYDRFTIRSSADLTTAILLLAVGVAVSQLAGRARRLRTITITDAGYLTQIHQTASMATSATVPDDVARRVSEQLIGLLDLAECRFQYGALLGHPPRLEPDGTVMTSHGRRNVELAGLPGEEIELRVYANGHYYGRFMMKPRPGAKPSRQARLVAVTLADQVGRAFSASESAPAGR